MTLVQWVSMKQQWQSIYENKTGKTGLRTLYSKEYEDPFKVAKEPNSLRFEQSESRRLNGAGRTMP